MKQFILLLVAVLILAGCNSMQSSEYKLSSPDGELNLNFWLENGMPYYSVSKKESHVIMPSLLGIVLQNNDTLTSNLVITSQEVTASDELWEQPWGQKKVVRDNHNRLVVSLAEEGGQSRVMQIEFKLFNDGLGFRYIVPEQENVDELTIIDELTEFSLTDNFEAWWIPAYGDNRYEYIFSKSKVNSLDTVHTPFTIEAANGMHISIHEAALVDYAAMTLAATGNNKLKCDLAPWSDGIKVISKGSLKTPWRTIQITDDAGGLITSDLILNLNEPNKLEDISWVKPTKYLGIWWGMHIGKYTFWESPKHGASTEISKKYIDYCTKLGIDHLLIEGWNVGWTPAWYENLLHEFSFTKSTSDFDFDVVSSYALENDVHLIGYHETGSNIDNYLAQIDAGMQMYKDAGMHSIKIGQVGSRMMLKEWHYGQYGVNYYQKVLDKAYQYQLAVNFHEPIKPTGLSRTYPHLMAGEGARGQEYNAWSEGNPPEHTVIIPFTRLLGGPMDFTPGIFDISSTRVHTTLAKQLALYLTIYSPIQMLADLPENYDGHPAFKFLQDVPVNWETTKVLNAKIGDYLTIVRKDINSDDWYLGSITDENARAFTVDLSFLEEGKTYRAEIYADGADAQFDKNPEDYKIIEKEVNNTDALSIELAKGGGQAIRFVTL